MHKERFYERIEFWIFILFIIRLIGITNPPLEINHHWRQVTGLMVSRNFFEIDCNPFFPRVDDTNGGTGIIGMEFPVMNLLYCGLANLFGYTHWYGRLINLILSSLGLLYFAKMLRVLKFSEKTVFASTLFLGVSIWFSFSRKMMPDTFCVSIMIAALYFGLLYLNGKKSWSLFMYLVLSIIASLSKIPAAIYFVFLIPLFFDSRYQLTRRIAIVAISIVPVAALSWWYFVWNPHLSQTYGNWYNMGLSLHEGFRDTIGHWDLALHRFSFDSFCSYVIFGLFLMGLFVMFRMKDWKTVIIFSFSFALFLVYAFISGHNFYNQSYYIIPIVPVMALVAGQAVATLGTKKWVFVLLLVVGASESIANQQHDFFTKASLRYKMNLEAIMDQVSEKDDLVMVNGGSDPQMIYLSHRKGWTCENDKLFDNQYVSDVIGKNCKFMVIDKHLCSAAPDYERVYEDDDFIVLSLHPKAQPWF